MGIAFSKGVHLSSSIANDANLSRKIQRWITIKKVHVPVDESGKLIGKVGSKIAQPRESTVEGKKVIYDRTVGPDRLPTFESFMRANPRLANESFKHRTNIYVKAICKLIGDDAIRCNGQYRGEPIVVSFSGSSMRELGSKLRTKDLISVPYMFDVLRNGNLDGISTDVKESHKNKGIEAFAYFRKRIPHQNNIRVQVDVALMKRGFMPKAKTYVSRTDRKQKDAAIHKPRPKRGASGDISPLHSILAQDSSNVKAEIIGVRIL